MLTYEQRYATCDAGVTRDGEYVPCDKPAVALRKPTEDDIEEFGYMAPWPVCAYHTRVGVMVPLTDMPKALGIGEDVTE